MRQFLTICVLAAALCVASVADAHGPFRNQRRFNNGGVNVQFFTPFGFGNGFNRSNFNRFNNGFNNGFNSFGSGFSVQFARPVQRGFDNFGRPVTLFSDGSVRSGHVFR